MIGEAKELEVGMEQDKAIIKHKMPNGDLIYSLHDPENALAIADAIGKASYQAKYGKPRDQVITLSDQVVERKRIKLVNRCNIMVTSMLRDGKPNEEIVTRLVDACLAEVL